MDFELGFRVGFRVGFSSWIFELDFELDFRVGFRVGFSSWIFQLGFPVRISSWIFELDFRVRIFWRDFFGGFFLVGFPTNFQWFYITYFVSGVAHILEVFSRWRRKRIADR